MSKAVFQIEYKCTNCGREWSEQYGKGVVVKRSVSGMMDIILNGQWDALVHCPTCGSKEYVAEGERSPIEVE